MRYAVCAVLRFSLSSIQLRRGHLVPKPKGLVLYSVVKLDILIGSFNLCEMPDQALSVCFTTSSYIKKLPEKSYGMNYRIRFRMMA